MTAPRGYRSTGVRYPVDPRMVPPEKVARRLGVTLAIFNDKLAQLEAAGFPKPDPILGNYCLQAVDRWIDARSGLSSPAEAVSDPSIAMERIRAGAWGR